MNKFTSWLGAAVAALTITACGGGDNGNSLGAGLGGGGGGAVSGSISSIVGSYPVRVLKADCDPENAGGVTVVRQADGSCKITTPNSTEVQRNILPEGTYTLKITADGAMEMLQGTASKAKISCPASPGVCRVDAMGTTGFLYTLAGGTAGATPGAAQVALSQIIFTAAGSVKSITTGLLYGLGANVSYTGTSPVQNGESGVLVIEPI